MGRRRWDGPSGGADPPALPHACHPPVTQPSRSTLGGTPDTSRHLKSRLDHPSDLDTTSNHTAVAQERSSGPERDKFDQLGRATGWDDCLALGYFDGHHVPDPQLGNRPVNVIPGRPVMPADMEPDQTARGVWGNRPHCRSWTTLWPCHLWRCTLACGSAPHHLGRSPSRDTAAAVVSVKLRTFDFGRREVRNGIGGRRQTGRTHIRPRPVPSGGPSPLVPGRGPAATACPGTPGRTSRCRPHAAVGRRPA